MAWAALKSLERQVVVITGATSGIGLATARLLASRGAATFLVARNEEALVALTEELVTGHHRAAYAVADVADQAALLVASAKAVETFGGYDSWINNAGALIFDAFVDTPIEDQRRLFDVNYWGVVHGTSIAAAHLRTRGGAIVTVGSVLGEMAIPFQGTYCASKFAVKGFTEAYRRELEAARDPISLTLVKQGGINTVALEHACNCLGSVGTRLPPPTYDPILVARAIAHACEHSTRDITVGSNGWWSPRCRHLARTSAHRRRRCPLRSLRSDVQPSRTRRTSRQSLRAARRFGRKQLNTSLHSQDQPGA